jgi:hypothetical protein
MGTLKQRKSPKASATLFPIGTKRTGSDGNQWMVEANKNGVRRWVLVRGAIIKGVKTGVSARKTAKVKRETKGMFNLYYKKSAICKGNEEGKCDPFMKEEILYELLWRMGFPNNPEPSMNQYDTTISFWGSSENTEAVKALVRREYTKLKERGAIQKFLIKDA